jgi:putative membrane protein
MAIAVSFVAEFAGTSLGVPFGAYEYTSLLGPKVFGRVPLVIPLSWFAVAVPAYVLAYMALAPASRWHRLTTATFLVVLWDVSLDPSMSYLTSYWVWSEAGAYFGMPLINLVGWALTGAMIIWLLDLLGADQWASRVSYRWMSLYYGILLLLPVGMCVVSGLWVPPLLTIAALGLLAGWARHLRGRSRESVADDPDHASLQLETGP